MIDRFISFVTYFPSNLRFYIGDYEFFGLRLRSRDGYPWGSRKERNRFFIELTENTTDENLDKYLYWNEQWHLDLFHRRFTLEFAFQISAYVSVLFLFLAYLTNSNVVMISAGALVSGLLLTKYLIHQSIRKLYFNLNMLEMLLNLLRSDQTAEESA